MPPYNFLWPLWSPALSPVNALGIPTPLVSSLTPSTKLSVQPSLAWNPAISYPYFIFNSPVGLVYYDIIYGINPWPPSYVIDSLTGGPVPLCLPVGFSLLPATDPLWIQQNLLTAILAYLAEYPNLALSANPNLALTESPNGFLNKLIKALPSDLQGVKSWLASLINPTPAFTSLLTPADILGY